MKNQLILATLAAILFCMASMPHEFWILPAQTRVLVGQRVPVQVTVGENFRGERWKGKGNRLIAYNHFDRSGTEELLLSLAPGDGMVKLPDFIPTTEGTHVLTLSTHPAFIELSPEAFDDYLKEEGLMAAYKYRVANNEKFEKGREKYQRCAKVIIQAGDQTDNTYKERTNLLLEIIPEKNPYNHHREDGLTFKVFYEGNPLPDAMVKWWHKDDDAVQTDFLFTDDKGEVTFSAAKPGLYMISVVHMIRLEHDRMAEWKSTWSSLVFGIEE